MFKEIEGSALEDVEVPVREMKETINFQSGKPRGDTGFDATKSTKIGQRGSDRFNMLEFRLEPRATSSS